MNAAVRDEMRRDSAVFMLGEDVRQSVRGVSAGLFQEFGADRVLDTPISEQAFTGFATGAALMGRRPIVEYQITSLLYLAFEQIVNQAQKLRLMSGGQAAVPVTYVVPGSGARRGLAAQHSDHPYSLFAHAGVKTVVPSTADDAYGLMVSAIRDDDPVIFFAPAAVLSRRDEVPDNHVVPLGRARIHRTGSDVTVVALGHLVHEATVLAERLADKGISVEIVDPRTILPLDIEAIGESVRKTGRLVVYDDGNRTSGFASEVLAAVSEEFGEHFMAPPKRVTRADAPVAFAAALEAAVLPAVDALERAVRITIDREAPAHV